MRNVDLAVGRHPCCRHSRFSESGRGLSLDSLSGSATSVHCAVGATHSHLSSRDPTVATQAARGGDQIGVGWGSSSLMLRPPLAATTPCTAPRDKIGTRSGSVGFGSGSGRDQIGTRSVPDRDQIGSRLPHASPCARGDRQGIWRSLSDARVRQDGSLALTSSLHMRRQASAQSRAISRIP